MKNLSFRLTLIFLLYLFNNSFAYTQTWTTTGSCDLDAPMPLFTMINACGNGTNTEEPASEYYTFATGGAPYNVNASGGMSLTVECPLGNINSQLNGYGGNAAAVAQLNALTGGCDIFVDAMAAPYNGVIPQDAIVWAFNTDHPNLDLLDPAAFVNLCSGEPIYVIFGDYAGNLPMFKNNTGCTACGCIRYITISFGGCTYNISYDLTQLVDQSGTPADAEGSYIILNPDGTVGYGNNGNCAPLEITCTTPPAPLIDTPTQALCQGQTPTAITCSNCNQFTQWLDQPTNGNILTTGTSYTPTDTDTNIWVQNLDGACTSIQTIVAITTTPPPTITLDVPTQQLCINQAITVQNTATQANTDYIWAITTPQGNVLSNVAANFTFTPTQAGTYTIALTADNGTCTNDAVTTIMVLDNTPTPIIAPINANICNNANVTFDASASIYAGNDTPTYQWTLLNTTTNQQSNLIGIQAATVLTTGDYILTLTITAPDACLDASTSTNFAVTPALSVVAQTACINPISYNLNLTIAGGTPPYTINGNPIAGNTSTLVFNTPNNYTAQIADSGTCTAQTINGTAPNCLCPAVPQPLLNTNTAQICPNEPIPTFSVTDQGYTYNWYGNTANPPLQTGGTSFTPPTVGTYAVQAIAAFNCTSSFATFTVSLLPTPNAPSINLNNPYCQGTAIGIVATADAGNTLVWSCETCNDDGSGSTFAPNISTQGNYSYTLYQQNTNGCNSPNTNVGITINNCTQPCPTLSNVIAPAVICSGADVVLTANINDPANTLDHVAWIENGTNFLGNGTNYTVSAVVNGCDPLVYNYTAQLYCTENPTTPADQQTVAVTYYPLPSAEIEVSNGGCTLTATPNCANWTVSPQTVTSSIVGDLSFQNFTVTNPAAAAVGLTCSSANFVGQYSCSSDCFFVFVPANSTVNVCDDQYPNLIPIQNGILVSDPTTLFGISWYENAALTVPISVATFNHTGNACNVQTKTIYAGALCLLSPATPIAAGQVVVNIYPSFDPSFVQTTEGTCGVLPTLSVSCPNYVVDLIENTMPADVLPGSSGNVVWNIQFSGAPAGLVCLNQNVNVPYACATSCRTVNVLQTAPAEACPGSAITLTSSITPLALPFGVQDSLQWIVNNEPIIGANSTTLNYTIPATDCDNLVLQFTLRYICIVPGNLSQDFPAGILTVHPTYNAANISFNNPDCQVPTISGCSPYNITPISVPANVNPGDNGTATWSITSPDGCFTPQTASTTYNCPPIIPVCPTITQALAANISLCSGDVLSNAQLANFANSATINDPDNTFGSWQWFADAALTQALTPAAYQHSGSCTAETFTAYLALLCTNGTLIAAGQLQIQVYPIPTTAAAVGGCSLQVVDNCGNNLVIEYETAPNVWSATPPTNPITGQTINWRAYVAGADYDNNGSPNCAQTGTATAASCQCIPPAAPTPVNLTATFCQGSTNTTVFEVAPAAGSFIIWTNAAGNPLATGNTYTATTVGTYTAQAFSTLDTCAGATLVATLTQLPLPDATFSYNPTTVCVGTSPILPNNITTNGGVFSANNGLSINANTGAFTPTTAGNYTITYTLGNACPNSSTASVTVVATPQTPQTNVIELSVCSNQTNTQAFTITNAQANSSYFWVDEVGDTLHTGTSFVPTQIGQYTIVPQTTASPFCSGATATVELIQLTPDQATISYSNTVFCVDDTPQLPTLVGTAGGTYSANNGLIINATTGSFVPNTAGTYTITYTTNGSCPTTATTTVTINNAPLTVDAGIDQNVCQGETITLNGTITGSTNSTWTGGIFADSTDLNTTFLPNSVGTYTLYLSAQNNCQQQTDSLTIIINPIVTVLASNDTSIFAGDTVQLNANGASNYTWTPAASLSCSDCPNPLATPTQTTTYNIATTDLCSEPTSLTITILPNPPDPPLPTILAIPNGFSPNGDGTNDFFPVIHSSNLAEYHIAIYNRWGEKMFETTNKDQAWDGTYKGKEQELGVYVYYIEYKFESQKAEFTKGNVTLLR
jgi:gliding motility-associated-like protein